jgi:hypothetical protein
MKKNNQGGAIFVHELPDVEIFRSGISIQDIEIKVRNKFCDG